MIATITCIYLNNQLQNNESKANPPLWYDRPTNNNIANANEAWIVLDNDVNKLLMIHIVYTLN
jgi:hypothetical protein